MSTTDGHRHPLEKIAAEFSARRRDGHAPTVEEYVSRFPELADEIRDLFPTLLLMERIGDESLDGNEAEIADVPLNLERLGDFRLLREVGRGGMGVVYEAEQESLGRRVALKVMLPRVLADDRQRIRFDREARSAARLHHTSIVPVFGVGEQDGIHYFVMQFIDGQGFDKVLGDVRRLQAGGHVATDTSALAQSDLARRLLDPDSRTQPELNADQPSSGTSDSDGSKLSGSSSGTGVSYHRGIARLAIQAADALDYAHSQDLLHRDIKPSNLMLDSLGRLWVTDFGLAKEADGDDLTLTGDLVGTLRYMAPERFQNRCTARSDIYALGVTLYELLTLQPAYPETDRAALVARIMNDEPLRPRRISPAVPRDLETIVLSAIAREPRHRYSTAAAMAEDLQRFLDDRPLQARRIGAIERLRRWCRRNPVVAALIAMVVLLIGAVAVTATVGYSRTLDALGTAGRARLAETIARKQAYRRTEEAIAARRLAEQASADAAAAVDEYFTRISENRLLDVPGLQPLRRDLLQSARDYYERLAARRHGGQDLRGEVAEAQIRLAQIEALIGSTDDAMATYEAAANVFELLSDEQPGNVEYISQRARCQRGLADLNRKSGRLPDAVERLDAAVELHNQIVALMPDDNQAAIDLAVTWAKRGAVHTERLELQDGVRDCQRAVQILRSIQAESVERDAALADAFNGLGDAHANPDQGYFHGSFEPYTESIRYRRKVLSVEPENLHHRDRLAHGLRDLANARFGHRQVAGCIQLLEEAAEISRKLHRENPKVIDYHGNLVATYARLGRVNGRVNDRAAAAEHYRRAIEYQTVLVDEHPDEIMYRRYLGQLWVGLGFQYQFSEQDNEARDAFSEAIEITEPLVAIADADAEPVADVAAELAGMLRLFGDHDAARDRYRQAIEAVEQLLRESAETIEYRVMLGQLHSDSGGNEGFAGRFQSAAEEFTLAIEIFEELLQAHPRHRKGRYGLYAAYTGRAIAKYRSEDYDLSSDDWDRAVSHSTPEHKSWLARWQGLTRVGAGDYRRAASAAEELQRGESLRFYLTYPKLAEKYRLQAARILSLSGTAARTDDRLEATEREQLANTYWSRSIELLAAAADGGLFDDQGYRKSLNVDPAFKPLQDHRDFRQLIGRLSDVSDEAVIPDFLPEYWPRLHFGDGPD